MNNFTNKIVIDIPIKSIADPQVETISNLEGTHTWLKTIYVAKNPHSFDKEIESSIDESSVKIYPDSIIPKKINITHEGLIHYVFAAWREEYGVVLSPDMLYFTIISEIKNHIIENPSKFRDIFTPSNDKQDLVIVGLTIDKLVEKIGEVVPCKEFFQLVTDTTFNTAPEHFKQVMGITFADAGTPYYNYGTTKCGIPKICILGNEQEWKKLLQSVNKIKNLTASICPIMASYLSIVNSTIQQIIEASIDTINVDFFRKMFIYGKNHQCGSGHAKVKLDGWIRNFYIGNYYLNNFCGYRKYIMQYSSHLNCLPYANKEDPANEQYYFYACGLASSYLDDGFLLPEYSIAHCEIVHPKKSEIYNAISQNMKN